jgi:outer membrane protein OmpA-like peptidoglycan-associated protein
MVKKHPKLKIDIAGYASKDGNPKYNLDLSHKRAMIVHDYLILKGIDDSAALSAIFILTRSAAVSEGSGAARRPFNTLRC